MKRVLALLSLVAALLAVSACNYDVNLSVTASALLYYPNGDQIPIAPVTYEDFHTKRLSNTDLENIFLDLTQHVIHDFTSAVLDLSLYDEIGGKHLRDETYGVVYNSGTGHYDFAEMEYNY